jgi:hypothetical protein
VTAMLTSESLSSGSTRAAVVAEQQRWLNQF